MAKFNPSLVGGINGRIDNIVVCQRMGKYYVRRYVAHPKDCRSEAQLNRRSVFKSMVTLASNMQDVLRQTMRQQANTMGKLTHNLFSQLNHSCFTVDEQGRVVVDYSNLLVSAGPVSSLTVTSAKLNGMHFEMHFKEVDPNEYMFNSDLVNVYAYCPDKGEGDMSLPVYRKSKRIAYTLPDFMLGHEVHIYAYCTSALDNRSTSNSVYAGCFTPTEA